MENTNIEELKEKANKEALKVSQMNSKERFLYYKEEKVSRKQKLNLLLNLQQSLNIKLRNTTKELELEDEAELLQNLRDVSGQITALRKNKNNSHFYEWKPNLGLNRKQRRQK